MEIKMGKLDNKIVIVTGGTKGIGLAISNLFASEGALVIACARNQVEFNNRKIIFKKLDVTNNDECRNFVDEVIQEYGHIDGLICDAGITRDSLTCKMTSEQFDDVINVNLKGIFNVVRYVGPLMQNQGYGSIVNISSIVGEYGNIGQANYAASKAGIVGMTLSWAKEFSRKGEKVRVNVLSPGYIMTDMLKTVPNELLEKFSNQTMLKRLGNPEEVANAALFLISDDSSYVTGTVISVDGGMRL